MRLVWRRCDGMAIAQRPRGCEQGPQRCGPCSVRHPL